jgi:hypothetical protein
MDGLSLLHLAAATGLKVHAEGDRLVIRGPKRAESIARSLLAAKCAVMAAIDQQAIVGRPMPPPGTAVCRACGRTRWWRPIDQPVDDTLPASPAAGWTCGACHWPSPALQVVWAGGAP